MLRPTLCLMIPFSLALGQAARGDGEPPPQQATSFETLMESKGLKRFGLSYILKDTEERDRQYGELTSALEALKARYRPLESEKSRLENAVKSAEQAELTASNSTSTNDKS